MALRAGRGALPEYLIAELDAELDLERIEGVAGSVEPQVWVRILTQVCPPVERVQVFDVGAIGYIEQVGAYFGTQLLTELNRPRYPHVKACETRPLQGVPAQIAGTVGKRVAILVGIPTGEDVEGPPAFQRKQRTEFEVVHEAHIVWDLADERKGLSMRYILA